MKKSLNINATRAGKKITKSLGYVNPDASNAVVGEFAQRFNALSNDSYLNAEVVKKMDTTEQETVPEGGGSSEGLLDPHLRLENGQITWDGNGLCWHFIFDRDNTSDQITQEAYTLDEENSEMFSSDPGGMNGGSIDKNFSPDRLDNFNGFEFFMLKSDGSYANSWLLINPYTDNRGD